MCVRQSNKVHTLLFLPLNFCGIPIESGGGPVPRTFDTFSMRDECQQICPAQTLTSDISGIALMSKFEYGWLFNVACQVRDF